LATRAKTKRGAIAFRPPTKISPNRPIAEAWGKRTANKAPHRIPSEIRLIKQFSKNILLHNNIFN